MGMSQPSFTAQPQPVPTCYRHPDRVSYIRCQRCGHPICPECMVPAAVGFQCPDCVKSGARQTRQNRNPFGGVRVKNPRTTTIVLIGINVVVWLAILATGRYGSPVLRLFQLSPLGSCLLASDPNQFLPGVGQAQCAVMPGMMWSPGVADGAFWQVLTSAFTHVEVWHIGCNMLSLWFLGPGMERAVGRARFVALYLLSALVGSASIMWFSDTGTSTLGASGAVFGLMGALLVVAWKVHGDVRTVLVWLGINLVYTFWAGGVSWQGHLGGLIGGALVAVIIVFAPRSKRERMQWLGFGALAFVSIAAIVGRAVMLTA